jgi:hypothetical protein
VTLLHLAAGGSRHDGKLHLAINENHQVLMCELTTPEMGEIPLQFRICSLKLPLPSRPSWVMAPMTANQFLKLF